MKRFSLFALFYSVAAIAVFLALVLGLSRMSSGIQWLLGSLGFLYGTVLYVTGTWAFFVACRSARNASSLAEVTAALPLAFLPVFIGLVGTLHGFINVSYFVGVISAPLKQPQIFETLGTVVSPLAVGAVLTLPSYFVIAVAMSRKLTPNRGQVL